MAKITFKGLSEYEVQLSKLGKAAEGMIRKAVYSGAGVVADEIRTGIENLPIVSGYGTKEEPLPGGVTKAQKQGLLDGLGLTPMRNDNGFQNVKIGFDGYNKTKTKKFPNGQPNTLVARGVESGTSWKKKKPFVRLSVNKAKPVAEQTMQTILDNEIKKIMD